MTPAPLQLEPLSAEAFAPFGEVIQRTGAIPESINYGRTLKYAGLARIETGEGHAAIHLYRSQATELPIMVERLERHPLGSQAFMPLHGRPFPVIVAPQGDRPRVEDIRGFISNGEQGINYHKGVWHHYQISLGGPADYLVVDREGRGGNFDEWILDRPLRIDLTQNVHRSG